MQQETQFSGNAPGFISESLPMPPSAMLANQSHQPTATRPPDHACRSLAPTCSAATNASPSSAPCSNCSGLVELLKKVKVDYDFNLSLIADRDAELKRWEDRDAWWRKRWKDSSLEKDQLAAQLKHARDQLATTASANDDNGLVKRAPEGDSGAIGEDHTSREEDLATIESLRATVRDLQAQLTAQTRRADASTQSLTTLTSSQRILESRLRETDRSLNQAQAQATAAHSALADAQAAETRARADRDALHAQLTQAHRERDQAVATAKAMAKDLKRLAHRVAELAAVGEQADAENAKLNDEVGALQAERERMHALVDATKDSAVKEMNRLRDEVARVREEHVQDRMAWMQEAKDREKVLAMAEARVQMQAEELTRMRDLRGEHPQHHQQQQYQQADRDMGHGEHAVVIEELEAENAELADVIRAMREEMERVANAHRRELDGLTERARAAESKGQDAEQRVEHRERALVEKNRELERLAEKVRLATASGPALHPVPQSLPSAATSMPMWNPQLGQWVIVPQPAPAHSHQYRESHSHPRPPLPSTSIQNPPPPTASSADHANALDSLRADYQTQLDHHRSQLLEALSDRERLISESNRLHAELRRVRSQLARVPQPPLRAETQVQTDPILIASMDHLAPPAVPGAAVATSASKVKRRGVGPAVAGGASSGAGVTKGKDGLVVGNGSQQIKAQSQSQGARGKSGVLEESKRDALLRLRKMGLRNWNDMRDDD